MYLTYSMVQESVEVQCNYSGQIHCTVEVISKLYSYISTPTYYYVHSRFALILSSRPRKATEDEHPKATSGCACSTNVEEVM